MTEIGEDNPMMTVRDLADILPYTEATIREWVKDNKFPNAIRVGRKYMIPKSDLTDFLNARYGSAAK